MWCGWKTGTGARRKREKGRDKGKGKGEGAQLMRIAQSTAVRRINAHRDRKSRLTPENAEFRMAGLLKGLLAWEA